jgi:type IV pilus assembly protein PilE
MKHLPCRSRVTGFTLIEMMCVLAIAGVLSSVAFPTFQYAVHKARRADALLALLQAQLAQERYRADHRSYGSLEDIRVPAVSPAGHYRLAMTSSDMGYEVHAVANGAQSADAECRHLKLRVDGADVVQASGRDERVANVQTVNSRCWGV